MSHSVTIYGDLAIIVEVKYIQALTASILIHILLFGGLISPQLESYIKELRSEKNEAVEVFIVDTPEDLYEDALAKPKSEPERIRHFADRKRRVEKESRAIAKRPPLILPKKKKAVNRVLSSDSDGSEQIPEKNILGFQPNFFSPSLSMDLPIGEVTALNTDQHTYFSFFSRTNPMVKYEWIKGIDSVIYNMNPSRLNVKKRFKSEVSVFLNPDGSLNRTILNHSSGESAFDIAAVQAFVRSAPYLNPPEEMVQENGLIHLKYSFNIDWDPLYLQRTRRQ